MLQKEVRQPTGPMSAHACLPAAVAEAAGKLSRGADDDEPPAALLLPPKLNIEPPAGADADAAAVASDPNENGVAPAESAAAVVPAGLDPKENSEEDAAASLLAPPPKAKVGLLAAAAASEEPALLASPAAAPKAKAGAALVAAAGLLDSAPAAAPNAKSGLLLVVAPSEPLSASETGAAKKLNGLAGALSAAAPEAAEPKSGAALVSLVPAEVSVPKTMLLALGCSPKVSCLASPFKLGLSELLVTGAPCAKSPALGAALAPPKTKPDALAEPNPVPLEGAAVGSEDVGKAKLTDGLLGADSKAWLAPALHALGLMASKCLGCCTAAMLT